MAIEFSYERLLHPAPSEGARTLLVGTGLTVAQSHHALTSLSPPPHIVGALVQNGDDALPCAALGGFAELEGVVREHRVVQVFVSLPLARSDDARDLGQRCDRLGVRWRFLPALADALAGRFDPCGVASANSAEIDVAQLIDRQPRPLDATAITRYLAGKTVVVTGAGGSIGSELARMICRFSPALLVLVERSENALFEIDRELAWRFPQVPRAAELHDVTQPAATMALLMRRRPKVVFHAAAHKHVPMMEDHPSAAVDNNFLGTRSIADAADAAGADRFVMISTDKAVNPSSVMGATKRLAELYIQDVNTRSRTVYSMVRFGNVLGSACSVLPIWTQQVSRGGPITVTHPEMSRYFMTIPEAAGLVLQAGALSRGGEVFLLDMGKPVRILDLARRFLRTRGYEPDVDIRIEFTGPRPGEKLFEELAYGGEDMVPTPHPSIRIWKSTPPDAAHMRQIVATLDRLRDKSGGHPWAGVSRESIFSALRAAVPEMVSAVAG